MEFKQIKELISGACKKHGVEEFEIYYSVGENISAETLRNEISAFSSGESAEVAFRCLVNGHMGYSSTSYFEEDELEDLVLRAVDNARVIENDDVVVIFKGSESYEKTTAPEPKMVDASELKKCALELQKNTYDYSDTVVDGTQMRSILSAFSPSFSAKNALLGMSLLNGKEGEKIAADIVTIVDDPMREGCPVQTCFDNEGVATYKKNVVENGVLKTLLYDLTTAIKTGKTTTGNGVRGGGVRPYNFGIMAGENTLEELFSKAENGVYVTGVKGLHAGANSITGDFSVESEGFLIENGKKASPVKSFVISGNFFELLKNIDSLSNEVKWGIPGGFTVFGSPDILVKDMTVAGK